MNINQLCTQNYVSIDKRDGSYFSGLIGWSNLEVNAIWYDKKDADDLCAVLNLKFDNNLYVAELPELN